MIVRLTIVPMLRVGMQPVTLCVTFKSERRAPGTIRSDYNATSFA